MDNFATTEARSELDVMKDLALLHSRKSDLEDQLKQVKAQITLIEPTVADIMTRNAIQNQTAHGRVLYLARDLRASKKKDVETAVLVDALQTNTMSDFVTYSPQRLTSFVREIDGEEGEIPSWLSPLIHVHEEIKVRSRKS